MLKLVGLWYSRRTRHFDRDVQNMKLCQHMYTSPEDMQISRFEFSASVTSILMYRTDPRSIRFADDPSFDSSSLSQISALSAVTSAVSNERHKAGVSGRRFSA